MGLLFAKPRLRIFISYRKSDSRQQAARIAELIRQRFGADAAFIDEKNLTYGRDYRLSLRRELMRSTALWAVIGPNWVSATDRQGRQRLFQTEDILREELEIALDRCIPVTPIVLPGATLPQAIDLPSSLNELNFCKQHAVEIASDDELGAKVEIALENLQRDTNQRRFAELKSWMRDYGLNVLFLVLLIAPLLGTVMLFPRAAAVVLMGLATSGILLSFPVWRYPRIYRLIRESRFHGVPQGWLKAYQEAWTCVGQAMGAPSIEMVAKLRTEVALLNPSPPMPSPRVDREVTLRERAEWQDASKLWKLRIDEEVATALVALKANSTEPPQIHVDTCFELNEAADGVERYLSLLQILYARDSTSVKQGLRRPSNEFFCRVKIGQGFLSPQHLIAGLQDHFAEDWRPVLDWYGRAVLQSAPEISERLKRIQVFQFLCWLMWGPSVPHCSCSQWMVGSRHHEYNLVLQYGYGDENNSWALMHDGKQGAPLHSFLRDALLREPGSRGFQCGVVVVPALPDQVAQHVCPAQRDAIQDAPMVLRLLSISEFKGSLEALARQIYQAYVWIMFVICNADGRPLFDDEPWRGLLPFFTHGNIADTTTFEFVRREVVEKALTCLRDLGEDSPNITFRYACSSDDGNCGKALQFPTARPTMPEILRGKLELVTPEPQRSQIRLSSTPEEQASLAKYSACHLSELVHEFYNSLPQFAVRDASCDTLHLSD